jgi:hypothetical protein
MRPLSTQMIGDSLRRMMASCGTDAHHCLADSRELSLQVRRSASPYCSESESHAMEDVALDRPLDPWVGGRTTRIHTNGHRGPAPLEPAAGVS